MKKILVFMFVMVLIASMTITAHAATPKFDLDLPKIPDISGSVKVEIPDTVFDNWFKEHPIKIDFSKIKWGWN